MRACACMHVRMVCVCLFVCMCGCICVRVCVTMRGEHQARGSVEEFIEGVSGMVRTLRHDPEEKYLSCQAVRNFSSDPWLLRHASWLLTRNCCPTTLKDTTKHGKNYLTSVSVLAKECLSRLGLQSEVLPEWKLEFCDVEPWSVDLEAIDTGQSC